PAVGWMAALAGVALAAAALPARVDEALERWFFPRAGAMRARLLAIGAAPLVGATRADAAGRLLRPVVAVLDGEGALVVLPARAGWRWRSARSRASGPVQRSSPRSARRRRASPTRSATRSPPRGATCSSSGGATEQTASSSRRWTSSIASGGW